ncbi:NAD(P)H oxidoreductase [Enterococcus faecalis]
MKVLTTVIHPRKNSLTHSVMNSFNEGLISTGNEVEVLDLYDIGFDPVVRSWDEPIWESGDVIASPDVEFEINRMARNSGLAFIFPIWWYMPPAMLKGYIDKVWQYNYAYGNARLPHERIQWIALAGSTEAQFKKRGYDLLLKQYLEMGLSNYTGIEKCRTTILYETLRKDNEKKNGVITDYNNEAYNLGESFLNF